MWYTNIVGEIALWERVIVNFSKDGDVVFSLRIQVLLEPFRIDSSNSTLLNLPI